MAKVITAMAGFVVVLVLAIPAGAAGTYNGGDGSAEHPYEIDNATQLISLSQHSEDWGLCFVLTADIDMAPSVTGIPAFTTALIGNYENPFTGNFDGSGFMVSNLVIDTAGAGNGYLGLFGVIDSSNAAVKNLGLDNISITGGNSSYLVGGICGSNKGSIRNCHVTGSISSGNRCLSIGGLCGYNGGNIINCYTTGSVTCGSDYGYFGGLCGKNVVGYIRDSYSTSTVSGGNSSDSVGGLCGMNQSGRITNCYANGSVTSGDSSICVGGLCGTNMGGIINNSYATGSVHGGSECEYLGGLCGNNNYYSIANCYATGSVTGGVNSISLGGFCGGNMGRITDCYSTGSVSGGNYFGGFCGSSSQEPMIRCYFLDSSGPDNDFGTPLTESQMKQQSSFTGWDFADETINGTSSWWIIHSGEYPTLFYFDPAFVNHVFAGQGTEQEPYLIYDSNDLGAIWQQPDCYYQLQKNLDLSGISWSVAVIPDFGGVLDGNGYTISNLTMNGISHLGLFGILASNSEVFNFGLENISSTGVEDSRYIGGLCGYNEGGSISKCYLSGQVTGESYSLYIGGMCGYNMSKGNIVNCYATDTVSGEDHGFYLGGLCGGNKGNISNCYSIGDVSSGTNSEYLGGLCGKNDGSCSTSYFLI